MENGSGLTEIIFSGFVGSVITQIISILCGNYKHHKEHIALLVGVVAECDYNMSIIDEVLRGVTEHNGSFKRLSVDYFRSIREQAARFSLDSKMISALSRVCIDIDLFNLELDYVFDGTMRQSVIAGTFGEHDVCIEKHFIGSDISQTITSARDGVKVSLTQLSKLAKESLGVED